MIALLIGWPPFCWPQSKNSGPEFEKLAADFWIWRAQYAPFTGDDVPRIERLRIKRDWSQASIKKRGDDLAKFERRLHAINPDGWSVSKQVDYRLIGSAVARVRWELDINPRWKRDPTFYIEQTLTPILEFIAIPGRYDALRSEDLLQRIENISSILGSAQENLTAPVAPFVKAAIDALSDVRGQLRTMAITIQPVTTLKATDLDAATEQATRSLENFRAWLQHILPGCPRSFAIGREAYEFYLYKVALIPHSIEELLTIGRQETERALALEALEEQRNKDVPPLRRFSTMDAWVQKWTEDETAIRRFLQQHEIVTVPSWVQHYDLRPIPDYVKALSPFGETDDFTSASRLHEDATRFVDPPSSDLDFFWKATAMDPRPILLHEGVPGHYFQLSLSWANKDSIRRHFYDSSAPEGIGYYSEEMMLQSGLFDDSPHTRETVYQFMALRAMGVEIDIRMALGEFTIEEGAAYLEQRLPLGHAMAMGGATTFATWPGVLVGYQTGKSDVLRLLADSKLKQGDAFRLRDFHDFLWSNGNVPFALQRWDYLGSSGDLNKVDKLSRSQR